MDLAQMESLTPRVFQAIWLMLRDSANNKVETSIEGATCNDLRQLEEIAQKLGFIKMVGEDEIRLTSCGIEFAKKKHWRFWSPPSDFEKLGIDNWFFDEKTYHDRPNVIDLFSGVGGLGLGFEAAGFRVNIAIDEDEQACTAHQINFPFSNTIQDDVSKLATDACAFFLEHNIAQDEKFDGIIGGPPCQGFSYVGERIENDERNLLTSKFIDVVLALRPKFFVMENVHGLMTSGSLPPFSKYIVRHSKTNSVSASHIVDALPPSTAKRDRQFRRRFVSDCIKSTQNSIVLSNSFTGSVKEIVGLIEEFYVNFIDHLNHSVGVEFPSNELRVEETCSTPIAKISIASIFAYLLKTRLLNVNNTRNLFDDILQIKNLPSHLQDAFLDFISSYDNAPKKGEFAGVKVGPVLLNLLERVSEEYLVAPPKILNAADYKTPQNRKRLFIVGVRKDLEISFTFPKTNRDTKNIVPCEKVISAYDAIRDLPNVDELEQTQLDHRFDYFHLMEAETKFLKKVRLESKDLENDYSLCRPTWNPFKVDCSQLVVHEKTVLERMKQVVEGGQDDVSRRPRLDRTKPAPTLRAGTKDNKGSHTAVRPIHYEHNRVITVREGARLMGYPDWMTFHETKWHGFRLVGNGVPFPLSYAIAANIMDLLYKG